MKAFVNYAHRGASQYAPENTLSAFYLGLAMGANGIETDVQKTKDGVLVLFHDNSLTRVTGQEGAICEYTLSQLREFFVCTKDGRLQDKIITLEEFLDHFAAREITFAIELKQPGVAKETIDLLNRYDMAEKAILTSFIFDNIADARVYDPRYRVGYLVKEYLPEQEDALLRIGGVQYCPKATWATKQRIADWHARGFDVRAWGVADEQLMRDMVDFGADGMTVNFPDLLSDYLKEKQDEA